MNHTCGCITHCGSSEDLSYMSSWDVSWIFLRTSLGIPQLLPLILPCLFHGLTPVAVDVLIFLSWPQQHWDNPIGSAPTAAVCRQREKSSSHWCLGLYYWHINRRAAYHQHLPAFLEARNFHQFHLSVICVLPLLHGLMTKPKGGVETSITLPLNFHHNPVGPPFPAAGCPASY